MLTISQLATYAGVTVRAIRHYHQIGLLPEPARGEKPSDGVLRLTAVGSLTTLVADIAARGRARPSEAGKNATPPRIRSESR